MSTTSTMDRSERLPSRVRSRPNFKRLVGSLPVYIPLIILSIIFVIPFYLILRNSLMDNLGITSFNWVVFPTTLHWDNFKTLFTDNEAPMLTGLKNSLIIAVVTLVLQMLFSSMAGFALARIPFRFSGPIFFLMIAALMIPGEVTFVPQYVLVAALGGVNTLWGIIVPGLFSVFNVFLFRQFYLQFPREVEEAGRVDGLGYFGIYWRLLLPNSTTIMTALGILALINSWNSFLWPLVIGQNQSSWTVQVVLSTFLTAQTINLAELFAGAAVGVFPTVIAFLIMQRWIVQGVSLSGLKA